MKFKKFLYSFLFVALTLSVFAPDPSRNTRVVLAGNFNAIKATGGTITYVGDSTIHTFLSGANFVVTKNPKSRNVVYLVVASGGAGGGGLAGVGGGGGGAGGMK